jgi:predicted dehydrogenase
VRPRLRALVVGSGYAGRQHVDALQQLEGVEVVALLASSRERAREAAAELAVPVRGDGFAHVLAAERVDVVHVCTPNDLHGPVVEAALRARAHVICEKPLAPDVPRARALVALARDAPTVTILAHNYRFFPQVAELRARVRAGELGTPHLVRGHFLQDRMLREEAGDWRVDAERAGASRAIGDVGSHWLDVAELLTGRVTTAVAAQVATIYPTRAGTPVRTEDQAVALLRLGDVDGVLAVSQVAAGRINEMEIAVDGGLGSATWRQHAPDELWLARLDGTTETVARDAVRSAEARELAALRGGRNESRRHLVRLSYEVIRKERSADELPVPLPTFADGLHLLEVAAAALTSARTRCWAEVPAFSRGRTRVA